MVAQIVPKITILGDRKGRPYQISRLSVGASIVVIQIMLVLAFFSCQNPTNETTLRVVLPQTALRDAPGEKGREIGTLKAEDKLTDLGTVSRFETQLRLGDQSLIAPWLQVIAPDGQTGWVFSGAVLPVLPQDKWLLKKRMVCYFGADLTARRDRWLAIQDTIFTETGFAVFYREALALRDTFTYHLAHRAEPNVTEIQPDFFWLREALPGFVYQRVAQGTQSYLFTDYRFFQALADRTKGAQDDELLHLYLAAYPPDSIESRSPIWTIQVSDNEVISQLGLDRHWQMLEKTDAALQPANALFRPELLSLKERVMEDIFGKVRYWQNEEKILAELNKILASSLSSLTAADRAALEARIRMFQSPGEHDLRVNLRAGE